ncbi:MAG: hypothetical protein ACTSR3_00985 [Candidatus Helarchaeota archaeon]
MNSKVGITKIFRLISDEEKRNMGYIPCSFPDCMYNARWWMNQEHVPFCDKHFLEFMENVDIALVISKKVKDEMKKEISAKTIIPENPETYLPKDIVKGESE